MGKGEMEHKQRSIILRVRDYGEADRIITFFTEDNGKYSGVAKNAKKSHRRFGGGLEPGTIGTVRYVERHGQELMRLEEITVEFPAWKAASSLARVANLHIAVELADKMLAFAHASHERFSLLARWITFLGDNEPELKHRHAFFYKWLAASGLTPVFEKCAVCGKKESPLWRIVPFHGGDVCKDCYHARFGGVLVGAATLDYLRQFKAGKIAEAVSYKEADDAFNSLIAHACGCVLKSLEVADKLTNWCHSRESGNPVL